MIKAGAAKEAAALAAKAAEKAAEDAAANPANPNAVGLELMPEGTVVTVYGLVNAQQYNGKQGTIKGFDSERSRFLVDIAESDPLALQAKNLQPVVAEASKSKKRKAGAAGFDGTSVYVSGLPLEEVTNQFLATFFTKAGKVFKAKVALNPLSSSRVE